MLKLTNTLGGKLEPFEPLDDGNVRMYTCGLTVYNRGHIGNFRTFVSQDVLRRYLKYKGYRVIQVMNFTDVDDKTIEGARAPVAGARAIRATAEPWSGSCPAVGAECLLPGARSRPILPRSAGSSRRRRAEPRGRV